MHTSQDWFSVRSPFARSSLRCDPRVATRLGRLSEPYFELSGEPGPTGGWVAAASSQAPAELPREVVAAQGEDPIEYAVDHEGRRIFHLRPESEEWQVQSLLRVTRAIHRSEASVRGMLLVHSGLVEIDGRGIALVGSSRAGKTSLIMATVLGGHARMVCNDDVGLLRQPGTGAVSGVGWPRSVSVRLDTFDVLFGEDRAREIRDGLTHPANQTLLRLREQGVEPHGTALLYPHEYAAITGAGILRESTVAAVVHLSLADDPDDEMLRAAAPDARPGLLEPHILREPNKHLNFFGHEPQGDLRYATLDAVTALPTYRYRYSFRGVRDAGRRLREFLSQELA